MADYGYLKARTFDYPLPEQQMVQQQQQPIMPQGQPPQMGEEPSELQYVRGTTEDVYKDFYKLKSFMSSMWKNYGIDVTNPDFTDEFSIKANQLWQESIAGVKFQMDRLKNSQKMLSAALTRGDQQKAQGVDLNAQMYDEVAGTAFTQKTLPADTQEILEKYQKTDFDQPELAKSSNAELQGHIADLDKRLATAYREKDYGAIDQLTRAKNAVGVAMYDSTNNQELAWKRAYYAQQVQDKTKTTDILQYWNDLRGGDFSFLLDLKKPDGTNLITNPRINKSENKLIYDVVKTTGTGDKLKSYVVRQSISLDNPEGFLQLLQETGNENVKGITTDVIKGVDKRWNLSTPLDESKYDINKDAKSSQEFFANSLSSINDSGHIAAINRLNDIAINKELEWPGGNVVDKNGESVQIDPGARIVGVVKSTNWFGGGDPNSFYLKFKDENNKTIYAKIDATGKDRDIIKRIITFNDLTHDDDIPVESIKVGETAATTDADIEAIKRKYGIK